jgi:hypothetical protein
MPSTLKRTRSPRMQRSVSDKSKISSKIPTNAMYSLRISRTI